MLPLRALAALKLLDRSRDRGARLAIEVGAPFPGDGAWALRIALEALAPGDGRERDYVTLHQKVLSDKPTGESRRRYAGRTACPCGRSVGIFMTPSASSSAG